MSAWNFGSSLLSSLFGFGSNILTNYYNKKMQDEANKTNIQIARETNQANRDMTLATNLANREMVREQNAAAAAEAEKAYQRSKPTTQVGNMQASGMSLAGAINSLNGGGSYSPAPVNTARDEASRDSPAQVSPAQMMSAEGVFANIAQAFAQRAQQKHDEKMQAKQLAAQEKVQRAQIESNERIAQLQADTTNRNADNRLNFDKEVHEYNKPLITAQINKIKSATKLDEINVESAELDNVRKRLELENMPTLMKLANQETMTRINRMILDYQHAVENHTLDTEAKRLQNEIVALTKDSEISFTNAKNELSAYMDEIHLRKNSKANGFFGSLELFLNSYMPSILKIK